MQQNFIKKKKRLNIVIKSVNRNTDLSIKISVKKYNNNLITKMIF